MTLDSRILDHKALYRADLHVGRLVARQPPTSLNPKTGELKQEPAAAIGMTMSGPLLRRLGHPEGYGQSYPWTKALWLTRRWCRKEHRYHRGQIFVMKDGEKVDLWRGSLCHEAVLFVVVFGWSVENTGKILQYGGLGSVVRGAFDFIESTIDNFRADAERKAREDEGQALTCVCGQGWSRHDVPTSLFRCSSCECSRYSADTARAA